MKVWSGAKQAGEMNKKAAAGPGEALPAAFLMGEG